MAHRHKKHHRAKGGRTFYEGGGSHVAHEAEEHKHGGKVHHGKHVGHAHGGKAHHRLHKRAHGGKVGSNFHPFSSAHVK